MSAREPSEEELRQALEEQIRRLRPSDVMVQTTVTLMSLAARRLGLEGEEQQDLEQARQAIDGARALMPLLPEEVSGQLIEPMSQLQVAYARAAEQAAGGRQQAAETETGTGPEAGDDDAAARAEARSKIWTPPGS